MPRSKEYTPKKDTAVRGEPTGDYKLYRQRGYMKAKLLEDNVTYSVYDGENYSLWDATEFHVRYINVPPAKIDNTELGDFE